MNCALEQRKKEYWRKTGSLIVDLSSMEKGLLEIYPVRNSSRTLNLPVAKTDMGKPLYKASNGGSFDLLREWVDLT